MKQLKIPGLVLGDDGIIAMAKCVKNIDDLEFGSSLDKKITKKGLEALSGKISSRINPVSYQHENVLL